MNENEKIIVKNLMELVLNSNEIVMKLRDMPMPVRQYVEIGEHFDDLPLTDLSVENNEVTISFSEVLFNWLNIETSDGLLNLEKYLDKNKKLKELLYESQSSLIMEYSSNIDEDLKELDKILKYGTIEDIEKFVRG